jgi:hypothetical protein
VLSLGLASLSGLAPVPLRPAFAAEPGDEEEEEEGLRQRLTEREDKRRPLKPWSFQLAGRPFTVGGEYEIGLAYLNGLIEDGRDGDRLLLEQQLEVESFYSFGKPLSLFAQVTVVGVEDLLPDTFDDVSDYFVERGEMWLASVDIGGSGVSVEVGRLNFDDDRRWWWDEERDAIRAAWETKTTEIAIAVARELGPERSDHSFVEPEEDGVFRVLGEASWDWSPDHALELFLIYHDDRSRLERPGEVVHAEREDDSDARLTWLGARASGVLQLGARGFLGYWLDAGFVRGEERVVEFEALSEHRSAVEGSFKRDVRGWGVDLGASWIFAVPFEPRVFAGYAFGSHDPTPEDGTDRSYRQSGLQNNESGFGGVERYSGYGVLLDPELSNIRILTVGAGLSLLRSSSLDLVYHYYRQIEPAPFLRDARLEPELTGEHRDVGHEVDLVLALEEWERFEFDVVASGFRAGKAFGAERGSWSFGGFLVARYAF